MNSSERRKSSGKIAFKESLTSVYFFFPMVSLELVISLRSQGQAPGILLLFSRSVECHSNTRGGGGRMGASGGERRGKLSVQH